MAQGPPRRVARAHPRLARRHGDRDRPRRLPRGALDLRDPPPRAEPRLSRHEPGVRRTRDRRDRRRAARLDRRAGTTSATPMRDGCSAAASAPVRGVAPARPLRRPRLPESPHQHGDARSRRLAAGAGRDTDRARRVPGGQGSDRRHRHDRDAVRPRADAARRRPRARRRPGAGADGEHRLRLHHAGDARGTRRDAGARSAVPARWRKPVPGGRRSAREPRRGRRQSVARSATAMSFAGWMFRPQASIRTPRSWVHCCSRWRYSASSSWC